jgi:hypothetical protein
MFEQGLTYLLRSFLGEFVEGGSTLHEKISIGVWSGYIVLEQLELKRTLVDTLHLPISLAQGIIGRLELKIPWGNIGVDPVVIIVDRVYLLFEPKYEWDADRRDSREQAAKQGKLAAAELFASQQYNERFSHKSSTFQKYRDGAMKWFMESILSKIVNNIQITIRDVHIRYEDKLSCPTNFSLGVTFESLHIESASSESFFHEDDHVNGSKDSQQNTPGSINKVMQLHHLCVYWNPLAPRALGLNAMEMNNRSIDELQSYMSKSVSRRNLQSVDQPNHHYILHPQSISVYLSIIPAAPISARVIVVIPRIAITLEDRQYREMLYLSTNMSNFLQLEKYSLYRPVCSVHDDPIAWWRYAIQVILHQLRSSMRGGFSSRRFNQRISDKLVYIELWKSKILSPAGTKLPSDLSLDQKRSTEFRSSKLYKRLRKISRDRRLQSKQKNASKDASADGDVAAKKQKRKAPGEDDSQLDAYYVVSALKPLTLESACLLAIMEFHLSFEDILYFRSLAELDMSLESKVPTWIGSMFSWASGGRLGGISAEDDKRKLFDALKYNPEDMYQSSGSRQASSSSSTSGSKDNAMVTVSLRVDQVSVTLALSYPYSDIDALDSQIMSRKINIPFLELEIALVKLQTSLFQFEHLKLVLSMQDIEGYGISPQAKSNHTNANGSAFSYSKLMSRRRKGGFRQAIQVLETGNKLLSRYPLFKEYYLSTYNSTKKISKPLEPPLFIATIELQPQQKDQEVLVDVSFDEMIISISPNDTWIESAALFAKSPEDLGYWSDMEMQAMNDHPDFKTRLNAQLEHLLHNHTNALIHIRVRSPVIMLSIGSTTNNLNSLPEVMELVVIDPGLVEMKTISLAKASRLASVHAEPNKHDDDPPIPIANNDESVFVHDDEISEAPTPIRNYVPRNTQTAATLPTQRLEFEEEDEQKLVSDNITPAAANDRLHDFADNQSTTTVTYDKHEGGSDALFDVFSLKISDVEVYLARMSLATTTTTIEADNGEDLEGKYTILERFDLEVTIESSVIPWDRTLPPVRLQVSIAEIFINLSDVKCIRIAKLVNEIVKNAQRISENQESASLRHSSIGSRGFLSRRSKHMKTGNENGVLVDEACDDDMTFYDALPGNQTFSNTVESDSYKPHRRHKPSVEFFENLSMTRSTSIDNRKSRAVSFDKYSNPGTTPTYDLMHLDISEIKTRRNSFAEDELDSSLDDDDSSVDSFMSAAGGQSDGANSDDGLSLAVADFYQSIQRHENLRLNLLSTIRLAESDRSKQFILKGLRDELNQMNENLRQLKIKYVESLIACEDLRTKDVINFHGAINHHDAPSNREEEIFRLESRLNQRPYGDSLSYGGERDRGRDHHKSILRSTIFQTRLPKISSRRRRRRIGSYRELLSLKFTVSKVRLELTCDNKTKDPSAHEVDQLQLLFSIHGLNFSIRHRSTDSKASLILHSTHLHANLSSDSRTSSFTLLCSDTEASGISSLFRPDSLVSPVSPDLANSHFFQLKYGAVYEDDVDSVDLSASRDSDSFSSKGSTRHNLRASLGFLGINIDVDCILKLATVLLQFAAQVNITLIDAQTAKADPTPGRSSAQEDVLKRNDSFSVGDLNANLVNLVIAARVNCIAVSLMKSAVPLASLAIWSSSMSVHHSNSSSILSIRVADFSIFDTISISNQMMHILIRDDIQRQPSITISLRMNMVDSIAAQTAGQDMKIEGEVKTSPVELVLTSFFVEKLLLALDLSAIERDLQILMNVSEQHSSTTISPSHKQANSSLDYFDLESSGSLDINIGSLKLRVEGDEIIHYSSHNLQRQAISFQIENITTQVFWGVHYSSTESIEVALLCKGIRIDTTDVSILEPFDISIFAAAKPKGRKISTEEAYGMTSSTGNGKGLFQIPGWSREAFGLSMVEGLDPGQIYAGVSISSIGVHFGDLSCQQLGSIHRAYRPAIVILEKVSMNHSSSAQPQSSDASQSSTSSASMPINVILSLKLSEISLSLDFYSRDNEEGLIRSDQICKFAIGNIAVDIYYNFPAPSLLMLEGKRMDYMCLLRDMREDESSSQECNLRLSMESLNFHYRPNQSDSAKLLHISNKSSPFLMVSISLQEHQELSCCILLSNIRAAVIPSAIIDILDYLQSLQASLKADTGNESTVDAADIPFRSSADLSQQTISFDHSRLSLQDEQKTLLKQSFGRAMISPIPAANHPKEAYIDPTTTPERSCSFYSIVAGAFSLPMAIKAIHVDFAIIGTAIYIPSSDAHDHQINLCVAGDLSLRAQVSSVDINALPMAVDSYADSDGSMTEVISLTCDVTAIRISFGTSGIDGSNQAATWKSSSEPINILEPFDIHLTYSLGLGYLLQTKEAGDLLVNVRQDVKISIESIFINIFTDISPLLLIYQQSLHPIIQYQENLSSAAASPKTSTSSNQAFAASNQDRPAITQEEEPRDLSLETVNSIDKLLSLLAMSATYLHLDIMAINIYLLDNLETTIAQPLLRSTVTVKSDIFLPSSLTIFRYESIHVDGLNEQLLADMKVFTTMKKKLSVKVSASLCLDYYHRTLSAWEPMIETFNIFVVTNLPLPPKHYICFLTNPRLVDNLSTPYPESSQDTAALSSNLTMVSIEIHDSVNINVTYQLLSSMIAFSKTMELLIDETTKRLQSSANDDDAMVVKKCYDSIRAASSKCRFYNESGLLMALKAKNQAIGIQVPSSSSVAIEPISSSLISLSNSFLRSPALVTEVSKEAQAYDDLEVIFPHDDDVDSTWKYPFIHDFRCSGDMEIFVSHVIETAATSSESDIEFGDWQTFTGKEFRRLYQFMQQRPSPRNLNLKSLLHPRLNLSAILIADKMNNGELATAIKIRSTLRIHNHLAYAVRICLARPLSITKSRFHNKWAIDLPSSKSAAVPPLICAKSVYVGLSLGSLVDDATSSMVDNSSKYSIPVPALRIEKEADISTSSSEFEVASESIIMAIVALQEQLQTNTTWLESESLSAFNCRRLRLVHDASSPKEVELIRYVHWIYLPNDHSVMAIYTVHDLSKEALHRVSEPNAESYRSTPIFLRELTIRAPINIINALGYGIEYSLGGSLVCGYIDAGSSIDITKYHPLQSLTLMIRFQGTNKSNTWSSACEISACDYQVSAVYKLQLEIKYPNTASLYVLVEVKEDDYGVRQVTLYVPYWISTNISTLPSLGPSTISYQHADENVLNGIDGLAADQINDKLLLTDQITSSLSSPLRKYRPRGIGIGKLNQPGLVLGPDLPILGLKDLLNESNALTDVTFGASDRDRGSMHQQFMMCSYSNYTSRICRLRLRQNLALSASSSSWSKPFSLDSSQSCSRIIDQVIKDPISSLSYVHSYGIVINSCPTAPFQRTQIVSVVDRYMIQNRTMHELEVRQTSSASETWKLSSNVQLPMRWQSNLAFHLQVRISSFGWIWSGSFSLEEEEITLRLKNEMDNKIYFLLISVEHFGPRLFVTCQDAVTGNSCLPYQIMNHTLEVFRIRQRNQPLSTATSIAPYHCCDYAWDEPLAAKVLCLDIAVGQLWRSLGEYSWEAGVKVTEQSFTRTTPRGNPVRIVLSSKNPVRLLDIRDLNSDEEMNSSQNLMDQGARQGQGLELSISVRSIGISLIDHLPEELLFISFDTISININQQELNQISIIDFMIRHIQIDGQLLSTPYPCILYPLQPNLTIDSTYSAPFVRCYVEQNLSYQGLDYYPRLIIDLQAFDLNIDGMVIARLIALIRALTQISASPATSPRLASSISASTAVNQVTKNLLYPSTSASARQKLFLQEFLLSAIKFNVSLNPIGANLSSSSSSLSVDSRQAVTSNLEAFSSSQRYQSLQPSESLIVSALKTVLIALGTSLAKIENSNLKFSSFSIFNFFGSSSALQQSMATHYLHQSIFQGMILLASSQATGNIAQFVSTLRDGVADFLILPFAGLRISPIAFAFGFYRGSLSLISRTSASIFSAAGQFASSLQLGLLTLGAVDVHLQKSIRRPRNAYDGVKLAVYGLIHDPSYWMKEQGLRGFVRGCSSGMLGLLARPAYGILVSLASSLERASLRLLPRLEYEQKYRLHRIRPPRFFSNPSMPLQVYSAQENVGRELLSRINHGEYVSEQYLWHHQLRAVSEVKLVAEHEDGQLGSLEEESYVLLTAKRLMVMTCSHQYRLTWNCLLSQLVSIHVDRAKGRSSHEDDIDVLHIYYLPPASSSTAIRKQKSKTKLEVGGMATGLFLAHKTIALPSSSLVYDLTKLLTDRVKSLLDEDVRRYLAKEDESVAGAQGIISYRGQAMSEDSSLGNNEMVVQALANGHRLPGSTTAIALPKPRESLLDY